MKGADVVDEQVTIGEIGRRMDRVEEAVTRGFDRLTERLDRDYVPVAVYAADRAADQTRIAKLEARADSDTQRAWQARLSLSLALLSVPASIVTAWLVAQLT